MAEPTPGEVEYPFTEVLMALYDAATTMEAPEGISHRDKFRKILEYVEVAGLIEHLKAELPQLKAQLASLDAEIRDLKGQLIILKSLERGKGQG